MKSQIKKIYLKKQNLQKNVYDNNSNLVTNTTGLDISEE